MKPTKPEAISGLVDPTRQRLRVDNILELYCRNFEPILIYVFQLSTFLESFAVSFVRAQLQFDSSQPGSLKLASEVMWYKYLFEPCHKIVVLSVLRKFILQTRMRSHSVGLDFWILADPLSTILHVCRQRRIWRGCADAQTRLSLRWSPMW